MRLACAVFLLSICAVPVRADAACSIAATPQGLGHFYAALDALSAGTKTSVAILHLGDSHIALDHLTGVLRARWQGKFGDAGRGLPPGFPYRYYAPDGYAVAMTGPWEVASSLPADATGPFGIAGFRVSGMSAAAEMTLDTAKEIGRIEIDVEGGPDTGSLMLTLGDAAPLRLSTRVSRRSLVRLSVPAANVHHVVLSPAGDGRVVLLGWAMLSGNKGIRYDSYGISGATMDVTERWDAGAVDEEIRAPAPDLVILGYGTNEGFDDGLDLTAYGARYEALIRRIQRLVPGTSVAVLGAFDGARHGPGRGTCGDGWSTPPKLDSLREMQKRVAARAGAWFFDGSRVMGRPCGIAQWAKATPPLAWPDRVHLRPEGAERAAEALWAALMGPYEMRTCRPHS